METKKQISLEVVNSNACGIDIGSRSHWVAVGQNAEDVKEFGVYSQDQLEMCQWMHSKNIKGKKTDIKDCQWIQKLHSLGLLSASFLPDSDTDTIRTYSRHRQNLLKQSASCTRRMQKYLRLMNMRLEVVVRDIVGLTGYSIIEAFLNGEHKGEELAKLRHYNCRKSQEEIAKALQFNGRKDYLFALQQEWNSYKHLQQQIIDTDLQIDQLLKEFINKDDNKRQHTIEKKSTSGKIKML